MLIEFENVSKMFGDVVGVRDLNFTVERGDVVGLLGANGAGKTTTMRLMTGYFPPSEGTVKIAGHSIQRNPLGAKRRIGYLPEKPPLYDEMVLREYLKYIGTLKDIPTDHMDPKIDRVLEQLELVDQQYRLLGNLSRGYRQRAILAQALVHEPDILVLDEPTLGLDPKQVRRLRGLILELAKNTTLVISSHILHEVRQICQRVIILSDGEMIAVDTPEKLALEMQRGQSWEMQVARPPEGWDREISGIDGVEEVEVLEDGRFQLIFASDDTSIREDLFHLCSEKDVPILSLSRSELDLEEIFLEITDRGQADGEESSEQVSESEPVEDEAGSGPDNDRETEAKTDESA